MSDILPAKELRHRLRAHLRARGMVADGLPVKVLDRMPQGFSLPETQLPAIYVMHDGERIGEGDLSEVPRVLSLGVVLMARAADPDDALDDLQLAVELAVIAGDGFGIARMVNLLSADPVQGQAGALSGVRVLRYDFAFAVTRGDPSF